VDLVMFAIYWGLKSWELSKSEAEWNAMKGKALKPPEPSLRATLASARSLVVASSAQARVTLSTELSCPCFQIPRRCRSSRRRDDTD
jgi:hypothetical protein